MTLNTGLAVSDVVNVQVTMSPIAAALRNFGSMLIVGASTVIDTVERIRKYSNLTGVGNDYSMTSPEFQAAALYFGQSPQPSLLYIGRWAQGASNGLLNGATLSMSAQMLANFTAVTDGGLQISIDGTEQQLAKLNCSAATNLNGVASIITTALSKAGCCVWNASYQRFEIRSASTGESSVVLFAKSPGSGTDLSALLGLNTGQGGSQVQGVPAESLAECIQALAQNNDWYGLSVVAAEVQARDHLAVAAYIEAASPSRIYGVTTQDPSVLNPSVSTDIASQLSAAGYNRSCAQYSSSSPYAVVSMMARAFTVDFSANKSTITLKFKQEPGVQAETINLTQAKALKDKHCNVFINYNNGTAVIQEGVMSGGWFFDERHGLDWLQNSAQTAIWNALYQSQTKIPQTDEGVNQLMTALDHDAMEPAANNGLLAPGLWTGPQLGSLQPNQNLTAGYYLYAMPVAKQSTAQRSAREAPPIQVAAKLAGAIHFANVLINVNR